MQFLMFRVKQIHNEYALWVTKSYDQSYGINEYLRLILNLLILLIALSMSQSIFKAKKEHFHEL